MAVEAVELSDSPFLILDESLEEVRFNCRQGVRPHCHCLDVSFKYFGFLERTTDGVVIGRLSDDSLGKLCIVCALALITASMAAYASLPLEVDVARSNSVLCDLLFVMSVICLSRSRSL